MADIYAFSDWDNKYLNQQEKDQINQWRRDADSGDISWQEANSWAEDIRKKYGYQGGADGSGYIPTSYTSPLQGEVDAQRKKVMDFSFDTWQQGTEYQKLLDRYTKAGQTAMQDTMGAAAARTGGLASSYAAAAGQGAYNQYMENLETAAQDAYDRNLSREQDKLALLQDAEQTRYSRWLDDVGLNMDQRDYNYQVGRDAINDQRRTKEWDYQLERDAINDQWRTKEWDYQLERDAIADDRYKTEWDYQVGRDEKSDALTEYEKALRKAETMAALGDYSGYKALGWTEEEIAKNEGNWAKLNTKTSSGGGSKTYEDVYTQMAKANITTEAEAVAWLAANTKYDAHLRGDLVDYYMEMVNEEPGTTMGYPSQNRSSGFAAAYDMLSRSSGNGASANDMASALAQIPNITQDAKQGITENERKYFMNIFGLVDATDDFLAAYGG